MVCPSTSTENLIRRQAVTVPELAIITGIPRRTLYGAARRGVIRTTRIGARIVVPIAEVERLLNPPPAAEISADADTRGSARGSS